MPRVRSQVVAMLEHMHRLREEIRSLTNTLKDVSSCTSSADKLGRQLCKDGSIRAYFPVSITQIPGGQGREEDSRHPGTN